MRLLPTMLVLMCGLACAQGAGPMGSYGFLVKLLPNDFNDSNGGAVLGAMNFDGAGGLSGPYTIQIGAGNGGQTSQSVSGTLSGTYTTNPDGTGTATINLPEIEVTLMFATVTTDRGQGMELLATTGSGNANNLGGGFIAMQGPALALTGQLPVGLLIGNADGLMNLTLTGVANNDATIVYTGKGTGTGTLQCDDGSVSNYTASVDAFTVVVNLNSGAAGSTGDYVLAVNLTGCGGNNPQTQSGFVTGNVVPGGTGNLVLHGSGDLISGTARGGQTGTLSGAYGFRLDSSGVPTGNIGVINFDGAGNLTFSFTAVGAPGTSLTLPLSNGTRNGTYTINSDGTGMISLINPNGGQGQTYSFVTTDGGAQLLLLQTTVNTATNVVFGTARAQ